MRKGLLSVKRISVNSPLKDDKQHTFIHAYVAQEKVVRDALEGLRSIVEAYVMSELPDRRRITDRRKEEKDG